MCRCHVTGREFHVPTCMVGNGATYTSAKRLPQNVEERKERKGVESPKRLRVVLPKKIIEWFGSRSIILHRANPTPATAAVAAVPPPPRSRRFLKS
jgi:hypothetical protein